MKLTKKLENEIMQVYKTWWKSYLSGDVKTYNLYLDKDFRFVGSTEAEAFLNKRNTTIFFEKTADQLAGKSALRNSVLKAEHFEGLVFITELADAYLLYNKQWTFYGKFRFSSVLRKNKEGWRFIYQHFSVPDSKVNEGETIGLEKITMENQELRDAIKRRTIELENKTRELEIETALERVRTVAMGMKKPEDMLDVCRIISQELEKLGVAEIRNVQTAIITENKGIYLNYEYFRLPKKKFVTAVEYKKQRDVAAFVKRMLRDPEGFFTKNFKAKDLEEWISYQVKSGQYVDPKTRKTASLHYYFYSIGPGALGISSYAPLSREAVDLFKRFRNVFLMAYRRFLDIEKAEAQAREAQIEAALEKVRAKVMAMNSSKDLPETSLVFGGQLRKLGIDWQFSYFWLIEEDKDDNTFWITWPDNKTSATVYSLAEGDENFRECIIAWKEQVKIHASYVPPEGVKAWLDTFERIKKDAGGAALEIMRPKNFKNGVYYFDAMIRFGSFGILINRQLSEEEMSIQTRFATEFERAYTRFLDLQKAEAQAREAQIELSLERVRARTMAMHKSEELVDTSVILFQELRVLGVKAIRTGVAIIDDEKELMELWSSQLIEQKQNKVLGIVPMQTHPFFKGLLKAWRQKDHDFRYEFMGEKVKEFYETMSSLISYPAQDSYNPREIFSPFFFPEGSLTVVSHAPLTIEERSIMQRFARVFGLLYRRFLDLQKAEAQAREAQIEAALERVRSHSMGMQKSEELKEVIKIVYQQLTYLKINLDHSGFVVDYTPGGDWHFWIADEQDIPSKISHPYFESVWANQFNEAKEKGADFFVTHLNFEEKNRFYNELLAYVPGLPEKVKEFYLSCPGLAASTVLLDNVALYIENFSGIPYTDEENNTLMRFGKVFQQTYTRFLDLQKAEAQTREAQINLAVERVRARALAMYKSEEILELVFKLKQEMMNLDIPNVVAATIHLKEKDGQYTMWDLTAIEADDGKLHQPMVINYRLEEVDPDLFISRMWASTAPYFLVVQDEEDFKRTFQFLRDHERTKEADESEAILKTAGIKYGYHPTISLHNGRMCIDLLEPPSDEIELVLTKMGAAFDLAYKRFEDLKNSEAQLREAQIEAALERTRTQSMLMQQSEQLDDVLRVFHEQVLLLGIHSAFSFLWLPDAKNDRHIFWAAWAESHLTSQPGENDSAVFKSRAINYPLDRSEPATAQCLVDWKSDQPVHAYHVPPAEVDNYFAAWKELLDGVEQLKPEYFRGGLYYVEAFMKYGCFGVMVKNEMPEEEKKLLGRFALEFERTYTRFLDLQKAEAQAREATIETSLERIRGKAMAMHNSQDLADTIGVFYHELQSFSITPRRCGVGLLNKEDRRGELFTWNTTEEGHSLELVGKLKMEGHPVLNKVYEHWLAQSEYHPVLRGKEIREYYEIIRPQMGFPGYNQDDVQFGYFFFFAEGGVYAWTANEMSEEELAIYRRFTSVLSLTYKRYKDLQQAEALAQQAENDLMLLKEEKKRTEEALAELQVTQKQLIQSEKMASLGELTAGIAHEIQNPLNFVNNFSEVSNELLDEMLEEAARGNFEEVKEILNDVKQNLEKINHHGKRADGIVKGMLQHSRSSSGQKEPTDINELADEYLRLAYHGLRAKDKFFNATMKTAYEEELQKVNVIPQDVGRVVLNLITNAFYVVNEKRNSGIDGYEPTVTVSTKKTGDKVELSVKDNGHGIPQKVLEKIFQPFFTTKPAGQGTGLGLSLSYDIVKAHGGELKVETREGEGTEFIVSLPL